MIEPHDSEIQQGRAQLSEMGQDQLADLGMHAGRPEDAGNMLDERAKASYKGRLDELHRDLEEARALSDEERAAKAEDEIDVLTTELKRAVGLGERDRRAASASERARLNATRAIKVAIERISEKHSSLASHLVATIVPAHTAAIVPTHSFRSIGSFKVPLHDKGEATSDRTPPDDPGNPSVTFTVSGATTQPISRPPTPKPGWRKRVPAKRPSSATPRAS